jgi:dephospho-CoA kinase
MNEQFIWNVTYNTDKALEAFDRILDIKNKLYDTHADLTIEETYQLREELMNIQILLEMTRNDLIRSIDTPKKNRIKRLFHRK